MASVKSQVDRQRALLRAQALQLQVKAQEIREKRAQVRDALRAMRPAPRAASGGAVDRLLKSVKVR